MTISENTSAKLAEFLLKIKAVKINLENPFQWSSGWKSPIYCDNRIIMSYPELRTFVRQEMIRVIDEIGKPEVIIGVATGGIAPGVLVAHEYGVPFAYVRPTAKSHGMKNQIEGKISAGQDAFIIEDLISTGGSSLKAVNAIRERNINVKAVVSIFNYGFDESFKNFKENDCQIKSLCNLEILLEVAKQNSGLTSEQMETVLKWRENPSTWG